MKKSKKATAFTSKMKFKNHLESIKATLVDYPSIERLAKYIPDFVAITWMENAHQINLFLNERDLTRKEMVDEMFARRTLPTAMETVRLTFFLEGLDLGGVTHVIRHRMFSYSAQSTDPATMEGHDILENDAFEEHPDLKARARKLCEDANNLYIDAIDRGMSFYDARQYMPRAKECKYYMSGDLAQFINFINVRLGRQNQPTSDNILALRMRQEIIKVYPQVEKWIPVEQVQWHYINAMEHKMNLNTYPPDKLHRKAMEGKVPPVKFGHEKPRDEYSCNDHFEKLFNEILEGKK